MGTFGDKFGEAWRNYNTDGVPASGDYEPEKALIRAIGPALDASFSSLTIGIASYTTVAALPTSPIPSNGTQARVFADPTSANNTYWIVKSGAWVIDTDLIAAVAQIVQPLVDKAEDWAEGAGEPGGAGTKSAKGWASDALDSATLADHYANDDTDTDVPGGAPGDRGAKYWASVASGTVAPNVITSTRVLGSSDTRRVVLANIPGPGTDAIGTIMVPSNSADPLPIGTMYEIVRTGGSDIRFAADNVGAAVIVGPASGQTIVGDNAWARLLKEGTDQWRLYGQLGNAAATAIAPKVWFDASDLSSMKQERTGAAATTAVAIGQPVGSWRNKGSLGGWAVIDADAKRPILQQRAGGFYEVVFDGVDDVLRLPTPGLNLASIEIYVGFRSTGNTNYTDGILTLAPVTSSDYNQNDGMTFYLQGNATQLDWVGGGSGSGGSVMLVSAAGVMDKAHTAELRKTVANAATMTLDANPGNGQINQSAATTAFGTQGGDLIIGARQGNGLNSFGNIAISSIVITNEPVSDPSSIRAFEETKTYGVVPIYPSIADTTALSAARATLINEVFSGAGIPSALGTLALESPNPLNGVVTFTNLNKCEKMTIPGYAARPRLWTPNSPRDDVIFLVCAGHDAGWSANGISSFVMQPLFTAGIRVCSFVLPGGPNDYTSGGPSQHESGAYTLADWAGPVSIAINKLLADFPGAAIYMTGISGGGWMTTFCSAVEARIAKSYQFVGTLPDMIYINRDWETRNPGLTADFLTLYMLAACPGRRHMQVLYENDPVAFNRANFSTRPDYSAQMATQCAAVGGGDYDLNWVNYNQHAYTSAFTSLVMSELP